ncbi:MAG: hypothetical protein AB9903_34255 [Vulcanimicrobiota bacterium]
MRLKKQKNTAEEELIALENEGYEILEYIKQDYYLKRSCKKYDPNRDNALYRDLIKQWENKVAQNLLAVFPTRLQTNKVLNPPPNITGGIHGANDDWCAILNNLHNKISALDSVLKDDLKRYPDLPVKLRLYIEDIDSFRKVRDVNPDMVKHLLDSKYYFDVSEDFIQRGIEKILNVPFHKNDYGGELNDLYTSEIIINATKVATAFLLKGNGLGRKRLSNRYLGKNGDQLVNLVRSPAQLFIVQHVWFITENVITDIAGKVERLRLQGDDCHYCIMDGLDTARLLYAYGEIK